MIAVFAVLAGIIIGGGCVGYTLSKRWHQQVKEAEQTLADAIEQHQQEQTVAKELKQQVADLTYQLNEAKKDLNAMRGKSH